MKNLILSFRIWLCANLIVCLLPGIFQLPFLALMAKYSFVCSFPAFYLLVGLFSMLRFYRLSADQNWAILLLTVLLGVMAAAQVLDWGSDWLDFHAGFAAGLGGALISLALHHRAIHQHFQSFRYETEL